jgi:hypothetical protein
MFSSISAGSTPASTRPPRALDELGSPAVVERDPEVEALVVSGLLLEPGHLLLEVGRRAVAAPDEAGANSLAREVGQLALDRLAEDVHQRVDLARRPRPVLGREGIDHERLHAEVDRRLDGAA